MSDNRGSVAVHEIVSREDEIRWDRFVRSHRDATGYHLIAWKKIFEHVFGQRTIYLFASDEEMEVRGVLPLSLLSSRFFGTFTVSLPAVNYGGVIAQDENVRNMLIDAAIKIMKQTGATHVELRQASQFPIAWPCRQNKVSMRLALPATYDSLWDQYPSKLRSQIRRAQKEGMITRIGGVELVNQFYTVFSRNMRDLGTPVYSRRWFTTILEAFPKEARICVVSLRDVPVAAGFVYGFRDMLEIPWASSSREHNHLAPNMLLYSSMLQYACEAGYRIFDFGRSTAGSSTYRFKEQWGAQPTPLHWYYGLSSGEKIPEINPQNPKYRLKIETWKRLPLAIANLIGPTIARCLP